MPTAQATVLTPAGVYGLPADGKDVLHFDSHIRNWPAADDLQLFGLHSNAGLALQQQEARQLLESVLCVQPREVSVEGSTSSSSGSSSSGGSSSLDTGQQQLLMGLVPELLKQLPPQLQLKEASILHNPFAPLPSGQINSLGTVLRHEIDRCGEEQHMQMRCPHGMLHCNQPCMALELSVHPAATKRWQEPLPSHKAIKECYMLPATGTTSC